MKQFFLLTLIGSALLLTGCARHYTLTLANGNRVTAVGKPRLEGTNYVFKDTKGQPACISAGRVREISPTSMTSATQSSGFKAELSR